MKCEDIQELLTDYMGRELGSSKAALVREHLRKCENCQAAARDIMATVDLLRTARLDLSSIPDQLSRKSKDRIKRAFTHPVIDWMDTHHAAISIAVAIILIAITTAFLLTVKVLQQDDPVDPGEGVEIHIMQEFPGTNGPVIPVLPD